MQGTFDFLTVYPILVYSSEIIDRLPWLHMYLSLGNVLSQIRFKYFVTFDPAVCPLCILEDNNVLMRHN